MESDALFIHGPLHGKLIRVPKCVSVYQTNVMKNSARYRQPSQFDLGDRESSFVEVSYHEVFAREGLRVFLMEDSNMEAHEIDREVRRLM